MIFVFSECINAQSEWNAQGARAAGMGFSSVAVADLWSVNNNQAGMAFYDKTAAGVYFENRFLVREAGTQSGALMFRTKLGVLGATVGYTGDANYNTTRAGLAYALKLGKRFAAGVQLDYIGTSLGDAYGKRSNITFDAGVLLQISDHLTFGAHTFNPMHVKLSDFNNESIPTTLNAGFGFTFSDKLLLTAEACKNSEFPLEFRSGVEYKLAKIAYARIGLTTNPARYTFGFGLGLKKFTLDFSSSVHSQLGYSPQVSMQVSL